MVIKPDLASWSTELVSETKFEELYRVELPRIYNYFRYHVGDGPLAEDLTSETFEKAWRNRNRYRRDLAAFSTWLFTIARRVATDYYRRRRNDASYDSLFNFPSDETTEDIAHENEEFGRLASLLAKLPDRERELVALKYGSGLTNRNIASLLGLTESNVGVILHRTVKILRKEWENIHE